jgi:hypothetical protein
MERPTEPVDDVKAIAKLFGVTEEAAKRSLKPADEIVPDPPAEAQARSAPSQ